MENMNYEIVNFNLNKNQNVQSQFNTHRTDTMYSHFRSPSMQTQSPAPSPVSQDPTLHSTPSINQDKTPLNHRYCFQQEYSLLQKQVPGVEYGSRNGERTNLYNQRKK